MVHAQVSDKYAHFALMYTTDNIFLVIPIEHLVNQYSETTMPQKLETGTKPSVSNLCVLFFPCVAQKATAHVETKVLNMRHQSRKGFQSIFVGITQHQKGYLIYVPSTRKIVSSHDIVFDEKNSSAVAYTSHTYSEALLTRPSVLHIPYAPSYHEQTGNIITFAQFEEGDLVENERNIVEDESILASIDESSTEDDSDDRFIGTNALKKIWDGSYINPDINSRYAILKIHDHINQAQSKLKETELSEKRMGKVLHKLVKAVEN